MVASKSSWSYFSPREEVSIQQSSCGSYVIYEGHIFQPIAMQHEGLVASKSSRSFFYVRKHFNAMKHLVVLSNGNEIHCIMEERLQGNQIGHILAKGSRFNTTKFVWFTVICKADSFQHFYVRILIFAECILQRNEHIL